METYFGVQRPGIQSLGRIVSVIAKMNALRIDGTRALAGVLLCGIAGCRPEIAVSQVFSQGTVIMQEGMESSEKELASSVMAAPASIMNRSGLVGALGGAHVKLFKAGEHEILLPLPQFADSQVPLCFYIRSEPQDAVIEYRLRKRESFNDVVGVKLSGKRDQQIQIDWSSVVLIAGKSIASNNTDPDLYRRSTPCVQADAKEIATIAQELWPENAQVADFSRNIQRFVRFDEGQWRPFDPSSLHSDVPTNPCQNIVMAKTTIADENVGMRPRMGTMIGCPYAQEIELLSHGIGLSGQDFFWTTAKPIAEFEPTDDAIRLAVDAWHQYLTTGRLSRQQVSAISAQNARELLESLQAN